MRYGYEMEALTGFVLWLNSSWSEISFLQQESKCRDCYAGHPVIWDASFWLFQLSLSCPSLHPAAWPHSFPDQSQPHHFCAFALILLGAIFDELLAERVCWNQLLLWETAHEQQFLVSALGFNFFRPMYVTYMYFGNAACVDSTARWNYPFCLHCVTPYLKLCGVRHHSP